MMIASLVTARRSLVRRCITPSATLPSTGPANSTSKSTPLRFQTNNANDTNNNKSAPSLFGSAAETYASLRWKFATTLTQSLSKDEQNELLGRLTVKEPQTNTTTTNTNNTNETAKAETKADDEKVVMHSIAEAVAAARTQEAQLQKAQWEKEKSKWMAEAEAAAKARVENELLIQHRRLAFERWQKDLEKESNSSSSSSPTNNTDKPVVSENNQSDAMEAATTVEDDDPEPTRQQPPSSMEDEPMSISDHPVLGSAIADLGYKRVHVASVASLKSLPVWEKQRTFRSKRAQSMASDKMKSLHLGMPGIIALHEDESGKLSIVDGQHRVGMMTILDEKKQAAEDKDGFFDLDRILVEVYPEVSSSTNDSSISPKAAHAQDIFLEINKAEPVKLVDLPNVSGLSEKARKTINEGAKRLEEAFPNMFSPSQRCRIPNVNVDNLRDALFASDVVKRHDLKSPAALEKWIMVQNEQLKKEYTAPDSKKASGVSKTALAKATKFNFFLGLDASWLYA